MASTSMAVTVANGSGSTALVEYRSVYLTFDHAALVTAKRSRTDGADLYMKYSGPSAVPSSTVRSVFIENANTSTARVWFSLASGIATSGSDNKYTLHWGDLTSSLPTVAADTYSQVKSGSYIISEYRHQPFAWFDDFKYTNATGSWVAITPGGALDSTRYGTNGTWTYAAGGVVTAPLGTGDQFFKATADQSRTTQRVRALITLGSGSGASCRVGVLTATNNLSSGATDLDGYGAGLRYSDGSEASLIEWDNGTHTTLDNSAVTAQVGLETDVDLEVNPSAPTQAATVAADTPNLSGTNGDHSAGYWGVYCDSTSGSGTFHCFRVMSMIWDGVTDSDITVSGTVPAISLPDCTAAFPVTETVMYPQAVDSFPDFLSPRSAAAVVGGYGERFDIGSFSVQWPFLTPTDYYEIIAFYESKKGSSFSWTPPGGSARTVRIRPGSLETTQAAPQKYEVSMSLDKVPL